MNFETLGLFGGPFEHVETYIYYDGPRTFAMRSTVIRDLYYVINTVAEDEDSETLTTLAVAVPNERFRSMRSGLIPFRAVFTEAPTGTLFRVDWSWAEGDDAVARIIPTHSRELPPEWFPSWEARLSLPTPTVEPFETSKLVALSQAQGRTIFALEVESDTATTTEFPARATGALQVAVDGAITSLAKESVGGELTDTVRDMRVSVLDLQAASFVLVLAVESHALFEVVEVTANVFEDLSRFVDSVASGRDEAVLAELKRHSQATRNRFRDILKPLAAEGSGLAVTSIIAHTNRASSSAADRQSVRAAVEFIDNLEPEVSHIEVHQGCLTGLFLRTKRFEIIDVGATGQMFKGEMSTDVSQKANGLPVGNESFVSALIRVERPLTNDDTEQAGIKYYLESIQPFASRHQK